MNEPLLERLAAAPDVATADALVEELALRAEPVIEGVVAYYRRRGVLQEQDLDDIASTVRMRLLMKLRRIGAGERPEIGSFTGYVAALTYNSVNDSFRKRDPERGRFKRQLRTAVQRDSRMVLETSARGIVCRLHDQSGEPVASHRVPVGTERLRERSADAIVAMLRTAGGPLLLDDVAAAMHEASAASNRVTASPEEPPSDAPAIPLRMKRRQDLEFLWREIGELPAAQRAALLLNMRAEDGCNAAALLALIGVATLDDLARVIGIARDELIAIWNDLPLDHLTIASRLGLTRQQVINLRKAARECLGRKMKGRR